jgi:hypothetical protein
VQLHLGQVVLEVDQEPRLEFAKQKFSVYPARQLARVSTDEPSVDRGRRLQAESLAQTAEEVLPVVLVVRHPAQMQQP